MIKYLFYLHNIEPEKYNTYYTNVIKAGMEMDTGMEMDKHVYILLILIRLNFKE